MYVYVQLLTNTIEGIIHLTYVRIVAIEKLFIVCDKLCVSIFRMRDLQNLQ